MANSTQHASADPVRVDILVATAVWGDWHLTQFLELNLPSLLAPGNLPALIARHDVRYVVYTVAADVPRLRGSPAFKALNGLLKVEIRILADSKRSRPFVTHHAVWKQEVEAAKRRGSFVLNMPPDVAWADGSFAHVADLLARGKIAIFMTYPRVVCETFAPAVKGLMGGYGVVLRVPPRDLVALAIDHLHPLMAAYWPRSDRFPTHAEMMLWPVPGEGISCRVLAREMFLYDPRRCRLNRLALPGEVLDEQDIAFCTDSDDLFAVSLAVLGQYADWHVDHHPVTPQSVGRWWTVYDSPMNDWTASQKIRWHATAVNEERWRSVEHDADDYLRQCRQARAFMRLWEAVRRRGFARFAQLLAVAIENGIVFRLPAYGAGLAANVPTDVAFRRWGEDRYFALLAAREPEKLIAFLGQHLERHDPGQRLASAETIREVDRVVEPPRNGEAGWKDQTPLTREPSVAGSATGD